MPTTAERAHRYARERGVAPAPYTVVRASARFLLGSWFRIDSPHHARRGR